MNSQFAKNKSALADSYIVKTEMITAITCKLVVAFLKENGINVELNVFYQTQRYIYII